MQNFENMPSAAQSRLLHVLKVKDLSFLLFDLLSLCINITLTALSLTVTKAMGFKNDLELIILTNIDCQKLNQKYKYV